MKDKNIAFSMRDIDTAFEQLQKAQNLINADKTNEAEQLLLALISQYPNYYAAHRCLAKLYISRKQYLPAFQHLAICFAADQNDDFSLLNLEALSYELGMYEAGTYIADLFDVLSEKTISTEKTIVHYFNKGKILLESKKYDLAEIELKKCLEHDETNDEFALKLTECYSANGQFHGALELINKYIPRNTSRKNSFIFLASSLPDELIQDQIKSYIETIDGNELTGAEEIHRLFVLARFYHLEKDYSNAWKTITRGNTLVKNNIVDKYNEDLQWENDFKTWAQTSDFSKPPGKDYKSDTQPLYILGPSRSGKSSLESALNWLPGIKLGLENKYLANATSQIFNAGDRLPSDFLPFLPDSMLEECIKKYREIFEKNTQNARIFTTTTPGLISKIPVLIFAHPDAKFIFMNRNPDDIVFRMYFKLYRNSHYASNDIDWCYDYVNWYNELISIWKEKFPNSIHIVKYEELVDAPEKYIEQILEFLEIDIKLPKLLRFPNDSGFSKPYLKLYK